MATESKTKAHKDMHHHHKEMHKHHMKELKHHEKKMKEHSDAKQDKKLVKTMVKKDCMK